MTLWPLVVDLWMIGGLWLGRFEVEREPRVRFHPRKVAAEQAEREAENE